MKVKINKYPKKGLKDRKVNIEIENFDTWSLDHTLALIILPALLQLKDSKHGVPSEFVDVGGADYERQLSFDFYMETYNDAFEKGCERWNDVLDKMIWSFQQLALEDYDTLYHHGKTEYSWEKSGNEFLNPVTNQIEDTYTIIDKTPDQHWYDSIGHRMHEERVQEGLELFGKYYRHLWD